MERELQREASELELIQTKPLSCRTALMTFLRMTPTARLKSAIKEAKRLHQANQTALGDKTLNDKMAMWRKKSRGASIALSLLLPRRPKGKKPKFHLKSLVRFLILLIRTCKACREMMTYSVQQEQWYALVENAVASKNIPKRPDDQPFVVQCHNNRGDMEELSFNACEYSKHKKTVLTPKALESFQKLPMNRTESDMNTIQLCLKTVSSDFASYTLDIQRGISRYGLYDSYSYNRVLIRPGKPAHGIYIVIDGIIVEKTQTNRFRVDEIRAGEVFGHHDVTFGVYRESTVLTKTETSLFFLHRVDYRRIFNMSRESHDSQILNVCRQHAVFQHFPLHFLANNPGVWSVWKYRHGRVIEKDSNDTDWIYVIKSGEARVLKKISPEVVDVKARRKKIRTILERECPYQQQKRLLNFISHQGESIYNHKTYNPAARSCSAPPGSQRSRLPHSAVMLRSLPTTPSCRNVEDITKIPSPRPRRDVFVSQQAQTSLDFTSTSKLPYITTGMGSENSNQRPRPSTVKIGNARQSPRKDVAENPHAALPPYIRVESLHPGDVFGFRSCLDASDRGPSVSLVSADCEVIQINKRFFIKHADDAVFSLIRLKAKPFPTQEELVDRLEANTKWAEYKESVITDYVHNLKKSRR